MKAKPKPWTIEDAERAIECWRSGMTDRQTAEALGRSREQVTAQRTRLKIAANRVEPRARMEAANNARADGSSGASVMDKDACFAMSRRHLANLVREYGATVGEAKAAYRARCELQIDEEGAVNWSIVSRFAMSACSSSAGWL